MTLVKRLDTEDFIEGELLTIMKFCVRGERLGLTPNTTRKM